MLNKIFRLKSVDFDQKFVFFYENDVFSLKKTREPKELGFSVVIPKKIIKSAVKRHRIKRIVLAEVSKNLYKIRLKNKILIFIKKEINNKTENETKTEIEKMVHFLINQNV
ncbi:MAG: ribonuclease P protein component [Candidatus Nomurabacteria bacterium]|nr:MAG: ribonuclease P protein component [Candidatus Nomurabacteria bacterium]